MAIKLIPRISDGQYSLGTVAFHPVSKVSIYTIKDLLLRIKQTYHWILFRNTQKHYNYLQKLQTVCLQKL